MNPPLSRVLVVEDGQEDAFVFSHLLEKAGLPVTPRIFRTGEAVLEYLMEASGRNEPLALPSVIFLDVWLPGVGGFDVLKWIRHHEPLQSTAVVLLSGAQEPRNLGKAAQLGADCYLIKYPSPSTTRELLGQLQKACGTAWPRPVVPVSCNLLLTRAA